MSQQKTFTDSFENLTAAVAQTVRPVVGEVKKVAEIAKAQVSGEQGSAEQGQAGQSQAQIAQMKQQDEADTAAKTYLVSQRLFQMVSAQPKKPEKNVQEKKAEENKVEQFKLMERKKKEARPLPVQRAQTAAERQRGASG